MTDTSIQAFQPSGGALSSESYQTFELAKENDSVLGGDNIAQIRSYAAYARAQAQAIYKTIAATSGIDDVAAIKEEATETAQTFAKVGIYADQRIGEILRELPTGHGNRFSDTSETLKADALKEAGIARSQAYDLQAMAANPEIVQAVLDKAEAEGRIPSRKQVLDAIRERDDARETVSMVQQVSNELERQRNEAREEASRAEWDAAELRRKLTNLRDKVEELEQQASEPQIVEREVVPADYKSIKHERDIYLSDLQKLRKSNEDMRHELDRAKDLLGMDKTMQDVRRDVQYLTSATIQYVRHYGGLTWTAASFEQVDAQTLEEFRKAVANLATFANTLMATLEDFNG